MSTQLFGPPNSGGSFADNVNRARNFFQQSRSRGAEPPIEASPVHGLAAEAPNAPVADAPAPAAAAPTGYVDAPTTAAVSGHDPDGLAAAARSAAEQAVTDPAVQQQVDVIVQPRIFTQAQPGPVVIPVDIAIPAAHTNVTIQPATAITIDAAGQPVVAGPIATVDPVAPPVAAQVVDAPVPAPAPAGGPNLVDRLRASTAGIGTRMAASASETANVVDAGATGVRAGLLDQLRGAAQIATKVNPRG